MTILAFGAGFSYLHMVNSSLAFVEMRDFGSVLHLLFLLQQPLILRGMSFELPESLSLSRALEVLKVVFVAGISVGDDFLANEHTASLGDRRRLRAAVGLLLSCRVLSGKSRRASLLSGKTLRARLVGQV
ncbi:hypothetical protein ACFX19_031579 [Malus domestica]